MFASRHTKVIEIETEGTVVKTTIQRVSGATLDKAAQAKLGEYIAMMRGMNTEALQALAKLGDEAGEAAEALKRQKQEQDGEEPEPEAKPETELSDDEKLAKRRTKRADKYDVDTILVAGIRSWDAVDEKGAKIDKLKGIADLEKKERKLLHESIIDHTLGPVDAEDDKAPKG